jgi:hypothetical protein
VTLMARSSANSITGSKTPAYSVRMRPKVFSTQVTVDDAQLQPGEVGDQLPAGLQVPVVQVDYGLADDLPVLLAARADRARRDAGELKLRDYNP